MDHIRARFAAAIRGLAAERGKGPMDIAEVLGCSRAAARLRWRGARDYAAQDLKVLLVAWGIAPELLWRRLDEVGDVQSDEAAAS